MRAKITTIAILLALPFVAWAAFDDVSLQAGTTLQVSVGGSDIDLNANSGSLEQVTVNAGNLQFILSAGSSISLVSTDKRTFTYNVSNAIVSFDCTGSQSTLSFSLGQGQSQETVIVTPIAGSTCQDPNLSGGGGGGSTSSSSSSSSSQTTTTTTTTTTTDTTPEPQTTTSSEPTTTTTTATPTTALTPTPISAPVVSPVFSGSLFGGLNNPDVKRLQQLLNSDPDTRLAASGPGSPGNETSYFGSITEQAVQKFQLKYGVVASSADPGYGYVGPKTRAMLQAVFGN